MASNAMSAAQLANFIPEYQSAKALAALEKTLVLQNVVTMDWREELAWGDVLNIPVTPNLGDAQNVSLTADLTLNAQTTTKKSITVNQQKYNAVGVGYFEQLLNRPNYLTEVTEKCVYSVAAAADAYVGSLFSSLTAGNVGTQGEAITDDNLIDMVENLNVADVWLENRHLVLDPESITDLFKIDKMLADQYVQVGSIESPYGFIGKNRYGAKVWMSNNLTAANTNYHYGAFIHQSAIGMIMRQGVKVRMFDWEEKHTNVVEAMALYGASVLRPTAGVCINTRS